MGRKISAFIKKIISIATERVGEKKGRSLHITGASCVGNTIVGLGKLVMGILSMSFFTCASALYTFGMVTAKCFALAGIVKEENSKEQYRYYKTSGAILIASSILYIIYSVRLFLFPEMTTYHEYVAMGIATFTFAELALNIRGVIIERNNRTPLIHAIRMINLASSLICLVLTQTAILSFASDRTDVHPQVNGFMGMLMGGIATLLGIIMIVRISRIKNEKNYGAVIRRVRRLAKKEKIRISIKPIRYQEEKKILQVYLKNEGKREELQKLRILSEKYLGVKIAE